MENISNIQIGPLPVDSPYVKPVRFYYEQNGVQKNWDLLKVHDSVGIVIHNLDRNCLVVVRQFRPGKCLSRSITFTHSVLDIIFSQSYISTLERSINQLFDYLKKF